MMITDQESVEKPKAESWHKIFSEVIGESRLDFCQLQQWSADRLWSKIIYIYLSFNHQSLAGAVLLHT